MVNGRGNGPLAASQLLYIYFTFRADGYTPIHFLPREHRGETRPWVVPHGWSARNGDKTFDRSITPRQVHWHRLRQLLLLFVKTSLKNLATTCRGEMGLPPAEWVIGL